MDLEAEVGFLFPKGFHTNCKCTEQCYDSQLCIVIKKTGKDIKQSEALDYVVSLGYILEVTILAYILTHVAWYLQLGFTVSYKS